MPPRVCIVSPDAAFARSIGSRLEGWGHTVSLELDYRRVTPSFLEEERVDVVLLAVGSLEEGALRWLASVKQALPALEVVLLNLAGEVAISIEGMRAGASQELSAPFDLSKLRSALRAALRRRRKQAGRPRPSLSHRFGRAMAAAAFAEAGEPGTALQILEDDEEGT